MRGMQVLGQVGLTSNCKDSFPYHAASRAAVGTERLPLLAYMAECSFSNLLGNLSKAVCWACRCLTGSGDH